MNKRIKRKQMKMAILHLNKMLRSHDWDKIMDAIQSIISILGRPLDKEKREICEKGREEGDIKWEDFMKVADHLDLKMTMYALKKN